LCSTHNVQKEEVSGESSTREKQREWVRERESSGVPKRKEWEQKEKQETRTKDGEGDREPGSLT
jgi:hypothetical protein